MTADLPFDIALVVAVLVFAFGVSAIAWFVWMEVKLRRALVVSIRQRTADQQTARAPNWDEVIRSVIGCRRVFGGAAASVYRAPGFDLDALVRRLVAIAVTAPDEKTAAMMVEHELSYFEATYKPPRPNAGEPKESTMDSFKTENGSVGSQRVAPTMAGRSDSADYTVFLASQQRAAMAQTQAPGQLDGIISRLDGLTKTLEHVLGTSITVRERVLGPWPQDGQTAADGASIRPGQLGHIDNQIDRIAYLIDSVGVQVKALNQL